MHILKYLRHHDKILSRANVLIKNELNNIVNLIEEKNEHSPEVDDDNGGEITETKKQCLTTSNTYLWNAEIFNQCRKLKTNFNCEQFNVCCSMFEKYKEEL